MFTSSEDYSTVREESEEWQGEESGRTALWVRGVLFAASESNSDIFDSLLTVCAVLSACTELSACAVLTVCAALSACTVLSACAVLSGCTELSVCAVLSACAVFSACFIR